MTDHRDPPGHHDPADATPSDVELSADELDALVAQLRDIPTPTTSVRSAHLAAALNAYDDLPASTSTHDAVPVAPIAIAAHRRRPQLMAQRWAVAAALVLVAGLGIGFAASSNGGSEDSASDAAVASQSNSDEQLSSEAATEAATEAAAAPQPGAEAADPVSGVSGADAAGAAELLQLGDLPDDDALRVALGTARSADSAKTTRDAAESAPDAAAGTAAGGAEAPETTMAGRQGYIEACAWAVPPGAITVAEGRVAGRPIVVVEAPGAAESSPAGATVIDLADCSTRTL